MQILDLAPPKVATSNEVNFSNKFPESDLPFYRKLGRTDLTVSALGLGGGGKISSEDTLYAFDQGVNFFFYSSDLHHYLYSHMSEGLRKLCGRGSSVREKVVLATVSYIKNPDAAMAAIIDQFVDLRMDYIDVFFWGWIGTTDEPMFEKCLDRSNDLRGAGSIYERIVERMFGVSERLKKMGAVRYIGASFHDLDLANKWLNNSLIDVAMVRHNVAHRTAQKSVFNNLQAEDPQRSGIVTFKSAGMHGPLWHPPAGLPEKCWVPSVPDLYRYSLSQNCVDVCLMGSEKREHIDAAIAGIQKGKLTAEEIEYLNVYGDLHRHRFQSQNIPTDKLIYRG
ncbi:MULTISPECIES: aldo/keto reductase [Nostoc]|jgi:aryl-alcohol dehydrogenase-like predicted oxidoreductase|uniref:Aldo/keto reductase n=1 Tax=Nostoc punctiforme FACHB-252 TaxID=1357509 RepID=A0ABR8H9I7_NOSPU|nr:MULTISPECIES: aldo/keto reductase [Nostoc]MBC1236974.1 aldo/keto reductase [Nostoc sp. 2RC]MBD2611941.1 aldo/keto reductase [Nostoc punctiforme FACHB-252]MBL1203028.1 aldo/keto reductase [Nostoc sp. GBBB01]MDZ8013520.1 aldo/keto reductase [Nostoc sp. ZfuVER08]